jgi:hypothetical protein
MFWDVTPCSPLKSVLAASYRCPAWFFDPEDEGDMFPRNVVDFKQSTRYGNLRSSWQGKKLCEKNVYCFQGHDEFHFVAPPLCLSGNLIASCLCNETDPAPYFNLEGRGCVFLLMLNQLSTSVHDNGPSSDFLSTELQFFNQMISGICISPNFINLIYICYILSPGTYILECFGKHYNYYFIRDFGFKQCLYIHFYFNVSFNILPKCNMFHTTFMQPEETPFHWHSLMW